VIRLSAPLLRGQPEAELLGTLAHEMIHQWEFDIRKRRPSHGPTFREMMDRMNEAGLGITIRHQLNKTVDAFNRYAWECVRCGMGYQRQRRTIMPARHLCSRCRGRLVEVPIQPPELAQHERVPIPEKAVLGDDPLRPQQLCFVF
jgi:predicted SprT family Zn-dependent metalloprotease